MNRIVDSVAQLLTPDERECVCGDVEELQLRTPVAVANVLGLVIRRQVAEWGSWGPWVALFGIAGLAGFYLSGSVAQLQTGLFLQIRAYLNYRVAYEPGGVNLAQQIAYLAASTLAILLWSWACGFVLAFLSGRSLWITSLLFYSVVRVSWLIGMTLAGNIILKNGLWTTMLRRLLPIDPLTIFFLLALALGVRSERKGRLKQDKRLVLMVAGLTLVLLLAWMDAWFAAGFAHWSGNVYLPKPFFYRVLPFLAADWPLFLIPLLQGKSKNGMPRYHSV